MKTLYLVRHAKAIRRNQSISDAERPLRKRGKNDARKIARHVTKLGPAPDVIISSPARRAIETAGLFAETWDYPATNIVTCNAIYDEAETSHEVLLPIVHALEPSCHTVMIVGHNPLFSTFAHVMDQNFVNVLPTCGVLCVALAAQSWAEVTHNCGTVLFFDSPKHDVPWLQPRVDEIASQLTQQMYQTLAAWHPDVASMMQTSLQQTGTTLARQFVERLLTVQPENPPPSS